MSDELYEITFGEGMSESERETARTSDPSPIEELWINGVARMLYAHGFSRKFFFQSEGLKDYQAVVLYDVRYELRVSLKYPAFVEIAELKQGDIYDIFEAHNSQERSAQLI